MLKKGMVIAEKYVVKERLGKGSSGEVCLVADMRKNILYTMKTGADKALLRREAYLAGEIHSQYFPAFVDYEEEENRAYLVLEYIEGFSLQALLDGGRCFSEEEIFILMEHVTAALAALHLHKTPLVHLDVKPANILLTPRGEVKLIDMGAGSVAGEKHGKIGGTLGYGAPEQFLPGARPKPAADVHACGKLLLYLLTGKNPAHPPYDLEKKLLLGKRVNGMWCKVIEKCLDKEPGRRYPDAGSLHKELRRLHEQGAKKQNGLSFGEVVYVKCLWKSDYERVQ